MKFWKIKVHIIAQELFQFSLIIYLILVLLESLKQGFVSSYFNLNIIFGILLISGLCMVLTDTKQTTKLLPSGKKITSADVQNSVLFAISGAVLIYFETKVLGPISYIISVLSFILILLLCLLLLSENDS